MKSGLVSVVIPAFKCASVISSAIESVLSQSYENIELIVVDDGSPDDISKAIEKFKDRITYIFQENGGVSKARNTGIGNAKGDFVAFLDADDTWDKSKIELQMEVFKRHPEVDLVFSGFWNTKNREILKNRDYKDSFNFFKEYSYGFDDIFMHKSSMEHEGCPVEYHWGNIYDYLFLGNFILPSSVMARKRSLMDAGMFNEGTRVAEETEFFLKYSGLHTIGFIPKPLVYYEIPSTDNLSGKSNSERLMKNALKIQIDSYISNLDKHKMPPGYYFKGISTTYNRLAYYYISEYKLPESRKYAVYGLKSCRYNRKSYFIWIMSFAPRTVLEKIAYLKRSVRRAIPSGPPAE